MPSYRIGTITGTQAGLSVTAIVQDVEWLTSATEVNHQVPSGAIYASNLINPRGEVKISAVVPRQYSNIPAAGGMITVKGCSMGNGLMSLNLDGTSGQSFQISGSRVVASNQATATLEITGYAYLKAPGSASFDWILTDEQSGYEYTTVYGVVAGADGKPTYDVARMFRSTNTMTWRKAIAADAASPGQANPGNLSPVGVEGGQWSCIDAGCSRPYYLNGQLVKDAFVTWRMVSVWTKINDDDSSSA